MKDRILESDKAKMREESQKRNDVADRLVESLGKNRKELVGDNWYDSYNKNPEAIRRTAIALKMQEAYLTRLGEAVTSASFPIPLQNLLKVIRLTYPNMIYPEVFNSYQMQRWHDAIYYLDTVYSNGRRDGVVGAKTYEQMTRTYSTEVEVATIDAVGAGTSYTGTIAGVVNPIRPYKVLIYVNGSPCAIDASGDGKIVGAIEGTSITITGTIDYSNGDYALTFSGAPNKAITVEYNFDSEVKDNYDEINGIELRVRDYTFRPEPFYLGVEWSLMSEYQLKGTLDQDIDEILTNASFDVIRQNKDIRALSYGYSEAKKRSPIVFNADHVAANALSMIDHLDSFKFAVNRASASIYNKYNRGQITVMYASADSVAYLSNHRKWTTNASAITKGCFKAGTLDGVEVFQVPNKVLADAGDVTSVNDIVAVYKDSTEENDVSIVFGEYLPIASTATLEFKEMYKSKGVYSLQDRKVLNPGFITRIKLKNVPNM